MRVIAIPNRHFPPSEESLADADAVLDSLDDVTVGTVSALAEDERDPQAPRCP
jgi:hypothetical protein